MLSAEASSAICVQRFDGSRNSAIHTTYRISLRSSSLREPRYPLLRVVFVNRSAMPARVFFRQTIWLGVWEVSRSPENREPDRPESRPLKQPIGRNEGYYIIREWMWMDSMILPQVHLVSSGLRGIYCSIANIYNICRARFASCSIILCLSELSGP